MTTPDNMLNRCLGSGRYGNHNVTDFSPADPLQHIV